MYIREKSQYSITFRMLFTIMYVACMDLVCQVYWKPIFIILITTVLIISISYKSRVCCKHFKHFKHLISARDIHSQY